MRDDDTAIHVATIFWSMRLHRDKTGKAYNVCADVAENDWSFEPMLAAAMIWTAQPQSMEAIDAIDPIVFESAIMSVYVICIIGQ